MSSDQRNQRLAEDRAALEAVKAASTIFAFEAKGDPPDRYTITFRGRGLARASSTSHGDAEIVELHRCDVRLPYSYPERPPDIRWLTPIFHPNISFSGYVNLREIGLAWDRELGLDVVCEHLWDVARGASCNLEAATNYSARRWYAEQGEKFGLPVDSRPLRDRAAPQAANVVRYRRRGAAEPEAPHRVELENAVDEVLYIGEDTPPQEPPVYVVPPIRVRPPEPGRDAESGDDDLFYIGPE